MTIKELKTYKRKWYLSKLSDGGDQPTYDKGDIPVHELRKAKNRGRAKAWTDNDNNKKLAQIRKKHYKGHIEVYYYGMMVFKEYYRTFKKRNEIIKTIKSMELKITEIIIRSIDCDYGDYVSKVNVEVHF